MLFFAVAPLKSEYFAFVTVKISAEWNVMNRPLLSRFFIVLACLAICIYYVYPPSENVTLGLDLKGGTSYTLQLDLSKTDPTMKKGAQENAVKVLRKRFDGMGVGEVLIQPSGADRVVIQIPGLTKEKKESTRAQIEKVAYLEFRLVNPSSATEVEKMKTQHTPPPAGYELMSTEEKLGKNKMQEEVLVKIRPELTGESVVKAVPMHDPSGYLVSFELNSRGAEVFRRVTSQHINERLAIVLDKKLISAPNILGEIPGGRGQITGNFSWDEAFNLANALENPLQTPVKVVEERSVEPTLGADSIKSGCTAGLIGLAAIVVFMFIYYLRAGFIANIALGVNVVLLFGVLVMFKFTLTLPGIAGIILTLGIAVDANVLIYERIREEMKKGKSLIPAIDAGYDRAFGTIIDANVTTLITALVLSWLGTGPVQGFGLTLSSGIITSVFAAVYVSRLIFDCLLKYGNFSKLTMMSLVGETKFNFLALKWPAFILSLGIIVAGAFQGYQRGNDIYGVDFSGGDSITLQFKQRVNDTEIHKALGNAGMKEVTVQYQKDVQGANEVLLVKVPFEMGAKAEQTLTQSFPNANFQVLKIDKVGGVVGKELQTTAFKGLAVATFCILIYISARFEFAFAVGAIVALLHDVLICLAAFFFTGGQLSLPVIGALLTIAGYSLNDTIVVFDRIREEIKNKAGKWALTDLINLSVNETLSRTLLTSLTTFLASLSLYIFGGGVIHDFAFILVVGVITGTYSSVFIASPVLLLWNPSKVNPQTKSESASAPSKSKALVH